MPALPAAPVLQSLRRRSIARAQASGGPLNGYVELLGSETLVYEVQH
jgi:hypothetical protein